MIGDIFILLIPLIFVAFLYYVVYDIPKLPSITLRKKQLSYTEYMQEIDNKITEEMSAYRQGMKQARELERNAQSRLGAIWTERFIKESDVEQRWQARRDLWRTKAHEFRAAQKQIANSEIYWTLGERSYESNKLLTKLKNTGDGWHLSLYLENCSHTFHPNAIVFEEKKRHLYTIRDPELKSFVMNSFSYTDLADYTPYYGTKKTRFDQYLEETKDDSVPELTSSKPEPQKLSDLEAIVMRESMDRARRIQQATTNNRRYLIQKETDFTEIKKHLNTREGGQPFETTYSSYR